MSCLPTELVRDILLCTVRQLYHSFFLNSRNYRTAMSLVLSRSRVLVHVRRLHATRSNHLSVVLLAMPSLQQLDAPFIAVSLHRKLPSVTRLKFREPFEDAQFPPAYSNITHLTIHLPSSCYAFSQTVIELSRVRKAFAQLIDTAPRLTHFAIDLRNLDSVSRGFMDLEERWRTSGTNGLVAVLKLYLETALRLEFKRAERALLDCIAVYIPQSRVRQWLSVILPMMHELAASDTGDSGRLYAWVDERVVATAAEEQRMHMMDAVRGIDVFSEAQPIVSFDGESNTHGDCM
ncbi:hypothetical protein BKA62DRAFT_718457 [Auriculariales sp. MPI-PUGE-AT-0066]|nr:hypothetical protein BKA62DRAFT_718457 [Auriculariales sp. MPI-PUGE-AT-0066]